MIIRASGKLLQTNKKWSHLKQSQKNLIYKVAQAEYDKYIANKPVPPRSHKNDMIIDAVYAAIETKEIWIPYGEVKQALNKFIDRQNRKQFPQNKPDKPDEN
ncbi:MAG: transposase [Firmicutes bacterium]|nr:transposase [Bacillota bacterium]